MATPTIRATLSSARGPAVAALLAMTLCVTTTPVTAAAPDPGPTSPTDPATTGPRVPCQAQQTRLDDIHDRIGTHNNRGSSVSRRSRADVDAYNADANSLETEQDAAFAALTACEDARRRLESGNGGSRGVTLAVPDEVLRALAGAPRPPAGWTPPAGPTPPARQSVPADSPLRAHYDALRRATPSVESRHARLQGVRAPKAGDPARHLPGRTIVVITGDDPAVHAEHIVPLAEVVNLPRFGELSAPDMWLVANSPINLQWMSTAASLVDASGTAASIKKTVDERGTTRDERKAQIREELTRLIGQLLTTA